MTGTEPDAPRTKEQTLLNRLWLSRWYRPPTKPRASAPVVRARYPLRQRPAPAGYADIFQGVVSQQALDVMLHQAYRPPTNAVIIPSTSSAIPHTAVRYRPAVTGLKCPAGQFYDYRGKQRGSWRRGVSMCLWTQPCSGIIPASRPKPITPSSRYRNRAAAVAYAYPAGADPGAVTLPQQPAGNRQQQSAKTPSANHSLPSLLLLVRNTAHRP